MKLTFESEAELKIDRTALTTAL